MENLENLLNLLVNTTQGVWEVHPLRTGRGGRSTSSWLTNIVCYSDKYPNGRIIAKSVEKGDAEFIVAAHNVKEQ